MLIENPKYSYNDIAIKPAIISEITSRSECNPFVDDKLPIFTAPMSCIVDANNYQTFDKYINAILPRNIQLSARISFIEVNRWAAFSLKEFENLFVNKSSGIINKSPNKLRKVLIDVANGHMHKILNLVIEAKKNFPNLIVMAGNIANPATIIDYMHAGIDYVRLGIGAGAGCITTSNVGIHYPMASLIDACVDIRKKALEIDENLPYINLIADGGIRNYNDVIKALALGADYVMIGGLFAETQEACGAITRRVDEKTGKYRYYREFYGMASSKGQIDLSGAKTKTSEGTIKEYEVKYKLDTWITNMADYLRSAMSYCNAKTIEEFKNNLDCIVISNNTYNSVNK